MAQTLNSLFTGCPCKLALAGERGRLCTFALPPVHRLGCRQRTELLSPGLPSVAFGRQGCLSPLAVFCYSHLDSIDWFSCGGIWASPPAT